MINFISGFPRAGTTLLCSILNQNPRFHATATSGILEIILALRSQWENVTAFKAAPNPVGKGNVLAGILQNYHNETLVDKAVVFDNFRGWVGAIELIEYITAEKAKVIVPVRSIVDILASFENLRTPERPMPQEMAFPYHCMSPEGRADVLMRTDQVVGTSYFLPPHHY